MRNVLAIKTSIRGDDGHSSKLVAKMLATWNRHHPEDSLTTRDLTQSAIPHLTATAYMTMPMYNFQYLPRSRLILTISPAWA